MWHPRGETRRQVECQGGAYSGLELQLQLKRQPELWSWSCRRIRSCTVTTHERCVFVCIVIVTRVLNLSVVHSTRHSCCCCVLFALCYVLLLLLLLLHARPPSEPEPRVPGLPGFAVQSKCPEHTASARYSERARRSVRCASPALAVECVCHGAWRTSVPYHRLRPCADALSSSFDLFHGCWMLARRSRAGAWWVQGT